MPQITKEENAYKELTLQCIDTITKVIKSRDKAKLKEIVQNIDKYLKEEPEYGN